MNAKDYMAAYKAWEKELWAVNAREPRMPKITLTEGSKKFRIRPYDSEYEVVEIEGGYCTRHYYFKPKSFLSRVKKALELSEKNMKRLRKWVGEDE